LRVCTDAIEAGSVSPAPLHRIFVLVKTPPGRCAPETAGTPTTAMGDALSVPVAWLGR